MNATWIRRTDRIRVRCREPECRQRSRQSDVAGDDGAQIRDANDPLARVLRGRSERSAATAAGTAMATSHVSVTKVTAITPTGLERPLVRLVRGSRKPKQSSSPALNYQGSTEDQSRTALDRSIRSDGDGNRARRGDR